MGVMQSTTLPRPVVPLPGHWTFWADSMVAPYAALGPVDVAVFTCSSKLSGFGAGQATIIMPDDGTGLDPAILTRLWSWRLWAFYEGQPYFCGVPTGITETGLQAVVFTLTELPGYLVKRQMDVFPTKVYSQVEQMTIASDLAAPLADIGVQVVAQHPDGTFLRDRQYDYLSNNRADLLEALSQVGGGPEFRAEYSMQAGRPVCTLRMAFSRVGSGAAQLSFTLPGNALAYQAQFDSDMQRTRTFAVGDLPYNAATNATKPVKVVDNPQAGLPRLDQVDDFPGVSVISTLSERASQNSQSYASSTMTLTGTASTDFPPVSTYGPGDDVLLHVTSPLFPDGLTVPAWLIQVDVDAGNATALWTMQTTRPPTRHRETVAKRINRIDRMAAGTFHGSGNPMSLV